MKRITLLIMVALLVGLPRTGEAKAPVEQDILDRTMDASSPYYYTSLMLRYNAGDTTLTDDDYHYLYYGYAYQESYKPLQTISELDRLFLLASGLNVENPDPDALAAILETGASVLQRDPFSPQVLNLMAFAAEQTGDPVRAKGYAAHRDGVLRAIIASGDGLTQKSPRHILMFDHALDVMEVEGLPHTKAKVISRTVEFIPLVTPYTVEGKKRRGFYFNFERIYWNKPEGYTYRRDRTWQFNNLKPRQYK